jgi:hypothetical protein
MHLTVAKLLPYVSIAAGMLILIYPRLLGLVIVACLADRPERHLSFCQVK